MNFDGRWHLMETFRVFLCCMSDKINCRKTKILLALLKNCPGILLLLVLYETCPGKMINYKLFLFLRKLWVFISISSNNINKGTFSHKNRRKYIVYVSWIWEQMMFSSWGWRTWYFIPLPPSWLFIPRFLNCLYCVTW